MLGITSQSPAPAAGRFKQKIKESVRDRLPDWFILIRNWRKAHGRFPNILRPSTYNEKILHRIMFDHRPLYTQLADKAAMRSYVERNLGPDYLPKLYYLTSRPETIPFDELPDRFVVKPTHGSGWVHLVADKTKLDRAALIKTCNEWLSQSFYKLTREWHYKDIEPRILIEEFIDDGNEGAPNDYKFFVFGGKVEFIQSDEQRFIDHKRRFYSTHWKKLDTHFEGDDISGEVPPPPHLAEMIAAVEKLCADWDFIRVDLYDTPRRFLIGEFTITPLVGHERFDPDDYDKYLGRLWDSCREKSAMFTGRAC